MAPRLRLNFTVLNNGHHPAAWRLKESKVEQIAGLGYYRSLLQAAEAGGFHSAYFPDVLSANDQLDQTPFSQRLEPLTLLAALAQSTLRIGLIAGVSTTHTLPYNLARRLASVDHVSNGRVGWAVVTSTDRRSDANYGIANVVSEEELRARGAEFIDVLQKLWDSWEDGAQINDKTAGIYVDTDRVHEVAHVGRFYKVSGPIDVPRPPQGRPVIAQEVRTAEDLIAESTEIAFIDGADLAAARNLYQAIKAKVVKAGRQADSIKVLATLYVVAGSTNAEARTKLSALEAETNSGVAFFAGSGAPIADHIESWIAAGGADGFDVRPAALPGGLDDFVAQVIPELKRRGLFPDVEGRTLRDHYGFARPASRYAA